MCERDPVLFERRMQLALSVLWGFWERLVVLLGREGRRFWKLKGEVGHGSPQPACPFIHVLIWAVFDSSSLHCILLSVAKVACVVL